MVALLVVALLEGVLLVVLLLLAPLRVLLLAQLSGRTRKAGPTSRLLQPLRKTAFVSSFCSSSFVLWCHGY